MLIGDVARRSGVSPRMLRHYESLGLLRPTGRTVAGYREYSSEDLRRIFYTEILRSLGLSLRDVGRALDDPDFRPAGLVDELIRRTQERIAAETELLTRLHRISAAEPDDWAEVLQTVALLQALGSADAGQRQRAALSAADQASMPVEALAEAVLHEADPNVVGALQWALTQAGDDALNPLADALRTPDPAVRRRAVESIVEIPSEAATALLRDTLTSPDLTVRRSAALALGHRGVADAIPTLVDMIIDGCSDVAAADALAAVAREPEVADQIAARLIGRLAEPSAEAPARLRITQALASIPGPAAERALGALRDDADRAVALTAAYILTIRDRPT